MQPYSVAALYASLSNPDVKLVEPGRHYSNWGYAVLGHVVEKADGQRFEDVLSERIFKPLGMAHSKIVVSPTDEGQLAVHYWPEDTPRVPRLVGFSVRLRASALDMRSMAVHDLASGTPVFRWRMLCCQASVRDK